MIAYFLDAVKIWDAAPHNAFTGLVHHDGRFYCTFREGSGHRSLDGRVRVIASSDGREWQSVALIESFDANCPDLRDPKIAVTPKGELLLIAVAAFRDEETGDVRSSKYTSCAWLSRDGENWSLATEIGDRDVWMWNLARDGDAIYGVGHAEDGGVLEGAGVRLYRRDDGGSFDFVTTMLQSTPPPNETALALHDGHAIALARRDFETGPGPSALGTSAAPYDHWNWSAPLEPVGGPALFRLPGGRLIAGGRMSRAPQAYTAVWEVDVEKGQLNEVIILPSLNDNGYPGFVWHDDVLWVSYYSGHEGKPNIYIARMRIE